MGLGLSAEKKINLYSYNAPGGKDGLSKQPVHGIGDGPTLICFGGGADITHEKVSKTAHFVNSILGCEGVHNQKFTLLAAQYPYDEKEFYGKIRSYTGKNNSGSFDQASFEFVAEHLLPLIANNGEYYLPAGFIGEKRDLADVKKSFRNIQIITHSFGSMAVEQIGNALVFSMKYLGYSEQEINEATKEILVMNVGGVVTRMNGLAKFTQLDITSFEDKTIRTLDLPYISSLRRELEVNDRTHLENYESVLSHPLNIMPHSPNHYTVFCDGIGRTTVEDAETGKKREGYLNANHIGGWQDERGFRMPKEDVDGHAFSTYLTPKPAHNAMIIPLMAQNVLTNALNNSIKNAGSHELIPLPELPDLLRVPQAVSFDQNSVKDNLYRNPKGVARMIGYDHRIEDAMLGATPSKRTPDPYPHLTRKIPLTEKHPTDFPRTIRRRAAEKGDGMDR